MANRFAVNFEIDHVLQGSRRRAGLACVGATLVSLVTFVPIYLQVVRGTGPGETGLLLLAGEALVVALTVVRRRARLVDRSVAAAVMTTLSLVGPPMLRASDGPPLALPTTGLAAPVGGRQGIALGHEDGGRGAGRAARI